MDVDDTTVEEIIDALDELEDDELVELQAAIVQEIASRNDGGLDLEEEEDGLDLEEDEDEDDDEL